jgi:hypothetical protein
MEIMGVISKNVISWLCLEMATKMTILDGDFWMANHWITP